VRRFGGTRPLWLAMVLLVATLMTTCAPIPASPSNGVIGADGTASTVGPKGTLRIAWVNEPENLHPKLLAGSGLSEYHWMFDSMLVYLDFSGIPHPMLAKDLPSQENGDWVINPDGSMVTTYRLRENARWHDGTPITAGDFVFGYHVYLDPDLPIVDRRPENLMSSVEAPDDHTITITWREPYNQANVLGYRALDPIPRHTLEEKYRSNKASFATGEEWTSAYVGSGPFRVDRWIQGSELIARGFSNWVLGPPKLDTIDIRFIKDSGAIVASLLSGAIDMSNSQSIRASDAATLRDQWASRGGGGWIKTWSTRIGYLEYQFREVPSWQPAITDLRVRQALAHATDREGIANAATDSLGAPADVFVAPSDTLFPDVDHAVTKYPYDPERAAALLADSGWRRPAAGALLANDAGGTLDMEVWATSNQAVEATIIADNWKAVGINSTIFIIPAGRERDGELRAAFPVASMNGRTMSIENFRFTKADFATPENRWAGLNHGQFYDPDVDRLYRVIVTSFDPNERHQATIDLHRRMSEVVGYQPIFYDVEAIGATNRVKGPIGNYGPQEGITWNVSDWQVTD